MHLTPHFPDIKIVSLRQCIAHEGVVKRWVDEIATNLQDAGVMKNPIIVTRPDRRGRRIVIDGMHRFAALRALEIADVLVYEIDYESDEIQLSGWDAMILRSFDAKKFLHKHFTNTRGITMTTTRKAETAAAAVNTRAALAAVGDRRGPFHLITRGHTATVDECVQCSVQIDTALDAARLRPVYVADALSLEDFKRTDAHGIVMRPHYSKTEIQSRTLAGKLFPRKSTRHLIPHRPLRVDVGIALLRAQLPLAAKNKVLREHLRWCYEADRIRYYPESVFVFSD